MKPIVLLLLLFIAGVLRAQIPEDYYAPASDKNGTALQQALHDIIDQHTVLSYSALWSAFETTDAKANGMVWDIYSDLPDSTPAYEYTFGSNQCGNYKAEGDCYNREHSFPKSWFNDQSPMYTDLFHIYPTDGYVNGRRGNYPYGETSSATWISSNGSKLGPCSVAGYSETIFEPIDAYKGDLARSYFYIATRYYGEDASWPGSPMVDGAQPKPWALAMLLQWSVNDPVSQKEIDRNNAIYALQGNRNPFIDHPEYTDSIWNAVQNTGVRSVANPSEKIRMNIFNRTLQIEQANANSTIRVYSSNGCKLQSVKTTDGRAFLRLKQAGFYLVVVESGHQILKRQKVIVP